MSATRHCCSPARADADRPRPRCRRPRRRGDAGPGQRDRHGRRPAEPIAGQGPHHRHGRRQPRPRQWPGHSGRSAASASRLPARAGGCDRRQRRRRNGDRVAEWLRHRFDGPVLRSSTVAAGDATWLQGQRVVAWAGIGSPQRFFAMLEAQGAEVVETVTFRDHQRLRQADAEPSARSRATGIQARSSAPKRTWHASRARPGNLPTLAAATRVLQIRLTLCRARCRAPRGPDRQRAQAA